jgi:lipopolysaccharide/colanic/teichoic acid biosynthesis glycosyltransferase
MTIHFSDISTSGDVVAPDEKRPYRVRSIYNQVTKRWIDITLVVLALPVVLPVVVLLAAVVALDGHNPFYSQLRIGRGGRTFRIWKIRSMVPDADAALETYLAANPAARAEWDATQKLRRDPRITRIGAILRKSSLDELPQLWNVLIGTMSLVGPRPMMLSQKQLYPGRAYYALRPGITGPWQVSDRNESMFAGRAAYDDSYARAVSFSTDLRLLFQTVGVVFRATGH